MSARGAAAIHQIRMRTASTAIVSHFFIRCQLSRVPALGWVLTQPVNRVLERLPQRPRGPAELRLRARSVVPRVAADDLQHASA